MCVYCILLLHLYCSDVAGNSLEEEGEEGEGEDTKESNEDDEDLVNQEVCEWVWSPIKACTLLFFKVLSTRKVRYMYMYMSIIVNTCTGHAPLQCVHVSVM